MNVHSLVPLLSLNPVHGSLHGDIRRLGPTPGPSTETEGRESVDGVTQLDGLFRVCVWPERLKPLLSLPNFCRFTFPG